VLSTPYYKITPLSDNNIEYFAKICKIETPTTSWTVEEKWGTGQGFRLLDDYIDELDPTLVICNPDIGWGANLKNIVKVNFNFNNNFTTTQQQELQQLWSDNRSLLTNCGWRIDQHLIHITGPMKIELVGQPIGWPNDLGRIVFGGKQKPNTICSTNRQ
jgi:hypothetical protein